jgi:hypothetical protein
MHHGARSIHVTGVRSATVGLRKVPYYPPLQASILFSEGYGEGSPQRFLAIGFSCRGS